MAQNFCNQCGLLIVHGHCSISCQVKSVPTPPKPGLNLVKTQTSTCQEILRNSLHQDDFSFNLIIGENKDKSFVIHMSPMSNGQLSYVLVMLQNFVQDRIGAKFGCV